MVALKTKHLAIAVPAIFALLIGLAMAFRVWDMPGRRVSDLADWGLDDDAVRRLVGGDPGAPRLTVREWCAGQGIGFGTVKGLLQAHVDAAGS